MTTDDRTAGGRGRGLDRLSRLELSGLGLYFGAISVLAVAQFTASIQEEATPTQVSWTIAAAAGAVICAVTLLAVPREWRKHGGRTAQRLGRHALWSNRLPSQLPARIAVLHDLERREARLTRTWLPTWATALFWALPVTLNISDHPSLLKTLTWLLLWTVFLVPGLLDLIDRRQRPRRINLIDQLRRDPVAPAASSEEPSAAKMGAAGSPEPRSDRQQDHQQ